MVYFTALFPYLILIIFFGRAVTLPGAGVGLKHLFTPKVTYERNRLRQPPEKKLYERPIRGIANRRLLVISSSQDVRSRPAAEKLLRPRRLPAFGGQLLAVDGARAVTKTAPNFCGGQRDGSMAARRVSGSGLFLPASCQGSECREWAGHAAAPPEHVLPELRDSPSG